EKKCVILLSNCANESGYELFENIMKIYRGGTWEKPRKLIADTLYTVMQKSSVADAIRVYKNLKKTDSTAFDYSSSALEWLGERLLLFKDYEAATAIFKLATEVNPDYAYGYFYLGHVYEKWGKLPEAIEAYQMAVTKDKNARSGIDAAFQLQYLKSQK
ncbi:MAG: tetratricopeptide repeat protein, partial [Ferruginibacter sp.]